MNWDDKVAYVRITSWCGISINAEHYYAEIVSPAPEYMSEQLQRTLTTAQARELNGKDKSVFGAYRKGEKTSRFDSPADIIKEAKKQYKILFPHVEILIQGSPSRVEPQPILIGPKSLKSKVNRLHARCEKLGWWELGNGKKVDVLCDKWEELMKILEE